MKLTISRHWNNPQIQTKVDLEGIEMSIELADFCEALTTELGPVTWVFRDATFKAKFDAAVQMVLTKIKEESSKVV